jgi:hypothetical protein
LITALAFWETCWFKLASSTTEPILRTFTYQQVIKFSFFEEIETFGKLISRLKLAFFKIVWEIEKAQGG